MSGWEQESERFDTSFPVVLVKAVPSGGVGGLSLHLALLYGFNF